MPHSQHRRSRGSSARGDGDLAFYEGYVSLTTRAARAGWRVRIGIAQVLPVPAAGEREGRLALTFRATLLRDGAPVAESRGRDMLLDGLPSVVWRDGEACADFVREAREWWPDSAEQDATIAAHVVRELVAERTIEIGEVYVDAQGR